MEDNFINTIFRKFLNESDLERIKQEFNRPVLNPRTQREIITYVEEDQNEESERVTGREQPRQLKRRLLLNPSSLRNYKCTLEKFGSFKLERVGREAPVTPDLINDYNVYLNRDAI